MPVRPLTHPFWTRPLRVSSGSRTRLSRARDPQQDISLLTSRFRSAALNRECESARARRGSATLVAANVLLALALGTHLIGTHASVPGIRVTDMRHAALALVGVYCALWLARLLALAVHVGGRAPRWAFELATASEVIARCVLRASVTIPMALAAGQHAVATAAYVELAFGAVEVAVLARYELAPAVCATVLGLLCWLALAPTPAPYRAELGVGLGAALSLPVLLAQQVAERSAWLEARRLGALRAEVSHFGLNHLYHATSTIELALELAEDVARDTDAPAADGPAAGRRRAAWLTLPLSSVSETLDEVTKLLRMVVDDDSLAPEARHIDFNLDDFAAIAFRGIAHSVEPSAAGVRACFASWAARAILADMMAAAAQLSSAPLQGSVLLDDRQGRVVLCLWARTDGLDLTPPSARRPAATAGSSRKRTLGGTRGGSHSKRGSQRLSQHAGVRPSGRKVAAAAGSTAGPAPRPPAELAAGTAHRAAAPDGAVHRGPLARAAKGARSAGGALDVLQDAECEWALIELSLPVDSVRGSWSHAPLTMPHWNTGLTPGLAVQASAASSAAGSSSCSVAASASQLLRAAQARRAAAERADSGRRARTEGESGESGSARCLALLRSASADGGAASANGHAGLSPPAPERQHSAASQPERRHSSAAPQTDAAPLTPAAAWASPARVGLRAARPAAVAVTPAADVPPPPPPPPLSGLGHPSLSPPAPSRGASGECSPLAFPAPTGGGTAAHASMPPKHIGVERSRFRPPATAAERAVRLLFVLDNHLDPPRWSGALTGSSIARTLRERGVDATVVLHTGCSPDELADLVAEGCVDAVILKDKAGRARICELCAQHELCVFVDDMPMVLTSLDLALCRQLYNKARAPGAAAGGWLATTNAHVRYAMIACESELDLVYAVAERRLVFDDNLLMWLPTPAVGAAVSPGPPTLGLSPSVSEHVRVGATSGAAPPRHAALSPDAV